MGAWGTGNFENDDALDWVYELEKANDLSVVLDALNAVNHSGEDYLDSWVCTTALAAAEVVAALKGNPAERLPDEVTAWVGSHGHLALNNTVLDEARSAISAILKASELQELWQETEDYEAWRAVVADLRRRL